MYLLHACNCSLIANGTYPYGMGRPRDDREDAVQDLARELADLASQLASLKGEAYNRLSALEYAALRHRLEDAHASVEAAAVEDQCGQRAGVYETRVPLVVL
jgi:regulator of replication initiation timing